MNRRALAGREKMLTSLRKREVLAILEPGIVLSLRLWVQLRCYKSAYFAFTVCFHYPYTPL
jgi:hypothetical protein